jgi:hypothetical protein
MARVFPVLLNLRQVSVQKNSVSNSSFTGFGIQQPFDICNIDLLQSETLLFRDTCPVGRCESEKYSETN